MRNSSSSRGMSQMRTEQSSLVEQLALARKERLERTKHRGQSQQLTGTTSERVRADGEGRDRNMEQTRARAADDVGAAGKGRPPAGGADKENSHPSRSCDEGDATVRRRKGNSSSHNSSGTSSGRARRPASMTLESDESDEEEESGARAGGGGEDDFLDGLASRMMTLDLAPGAAQESRSGRKDRKNDSIKDHKLPQDAPGGARHSASGRGAPPEVLELPEKVQGMLYPHQVVGVQWLWSLQKLRRGGILADDMGLGKTMQVSAFLSGVLRPRGRVRRALIVAPKTLLEHWAKELRTCGLGGRTHQYFGGSQADRRSALSAVVRSPGVLLTTYGMVLHNSEALAGRGDVSAAARSRSNLFGNDDDEEDEEEEDAPMWDIMILDEGHKVKNPKMQLVKHLKEIGTGIRVIISGTPIQNNLMEFHALLDFAAPGLLGDRKTFKRAFEDPISAGSDKTASHREREVCAATAAKLRATTAPYILRREKKEVLPGGGGSSSSSSSSVPSGSASGAEDSSAAEADSGGPRPKAMGRKNDLIVWLKLAPMQRRVYEAFLNSDSVKAVLNQTRSALAAITVLKKVCDHPALLSSQAANLVMRGGSRLAGKRGGHGTDSSSDDIDSDDDDDDFVSCSSDDDFIVDDDDSDLGSCRPKKTKGKGKSRRRKDVLDSDSEDSAVAVTDESHETTAEDTDGADWWTWGGEDIQAQLLDALARKGAEASCKTTFIVSLLKNHIKNGHRTLVFSQSRVMLDILQAELRDLGVSFLRIDGGSSASERQDLVSRFQRRGCDIPVFLLTSQVGGLGLTLTAADRVIIVDPAWNPSTDNQSVDRAYRIGQEKDVVVYRLITCGTVEEKIYRKQVYKGGISRAGMDDGNHYRYFSHEDLRDLFSANPEDLVESRTQKQLHALHASQRVISNDLSSHLDWLGSLPTFAGVSDHDLIYSKESSDGFHHSSKTATAMDLSAQQQQPVFALGGGSRKPGGGRQRGGPSPGWAGAPGGSGGGAGGGDGMDLSDRLAAALRLSLPEKPDPAAALKNKEEKLERELASRKALAARMDTSSLPDGGQKLRLSVLALEEQLAAVREEAASQSLGGEPQDPPQPEDAGKAEAPGPVEGRGKAPREKEAAAPGIVKGLPPPPAPSAPVAPDSAAAAAAPPSAIGLQARPPAPPAAAAAAAGGAGTAAAKAPKEAARNNHGPSAATSSPSNGGVGNKEEGGAELRVMKQELIEMDRRARALAAAAESGDPKAAAAHQELRGQQSSLLVTYRRNKAAALKKQLIDLDQVLRGTRPLPGGHSRQQVKDEARAVRADYDRAKVELQKVEKAPGGSRP